MPRMSSSKVMKFSAHGKGVHDFCLEWGDNCGQI